MTSENYKLYDLEEEIKKYTEISNIYNDSKEDYNETNKHKVRNDFTELLIKKAKIPELLARDWK